jgi:oligoendopeptidase F
MLSDAEERLSTIKDLNGSSALEKIYDLITSNFEYEFQGKKLNQQELVEFVRNPDRAVRKAAYEKLFEPYEKNKDVLGAIYTHIIDDWRRESELRKHPRSISVRNHANDIPDTAVDALLSVCKKNASVFQEYFQKKAGILGIKDFARYDLYAPLDDTKETLTFDEAVKKILSVFTKFHPDFATAAQKIVDEQHIHAKIQQGKRGGAYCYGPSPEDTPYVLLSYTGTPESVSTLAHELGHGVHGILANKHNAFNHHAQLPVCETASIFSELILAEQLKEEKPELARSMTMNQIDGFYASIMRQAWFVIFEEKAHTMVADSPTIDEMSEEYMEELKEQFSKMEIPQHFQYEWIYIPHIFHSPFYCYAYSFGNLLSLALYAQYKKNPAFVDDIMKLLAAGGSASPAEMVKTAGFDIADEAFWQGGFDVIEEMIKGL